MAGYKGYSMSNNAVAAYEDGEKPMSKWTKADILKQMKEDGVPKHKIEEISKMDAATMKNTFLQRSSWHHTSSHYNKTDFYTVDTSRAEDYDMKGYSKPKPKAKAEKKEDVGYRVNATYLEWSGTRNHPKATEVDADGVIKGNWFYPDRSGGMKKSTTARGFTINREYQKQTKRRSLRSFFRR